MDAEIIISLLSQDKLWVVVVLVLGFMCWTLLKWWREETQGRLNDAKERDAAWQKMSREQIEAGNVTANAIRELAAEVRSRG